MESSVVLIRQEHRRDQKRWEELKMLSLEKIKNGWWELC